MTAPGGEPSVLVDARGTLCPRPVIDAATAARGLPVGTLLQVWASDPAAALDLPAWCRLRGHELLSVTRADPPDGTGQPDDVPVRVVVRLR